MEEVKEIVEGVKGDIEEIKERETILKSSVETCIKQHNELEGFIKGLEGEISSVREGVIKGLMNEISSVREGNQKLDAEICKIQKLESLINYLDGELFKHNFSLKSDIEGVDEKQKTLSSKIEKLEFKKAVEELDDLMEKKKKLFAEVREVVEKIEDTIDSLLSLTVQLNFGNNFLGFVVQYHSTCRNWWTLILLTAVFLFFLGSNIIFSWCRVSNCFDVINYLCRDGDKLKVEFEQLSDPAREKFNIESIIRDKYWPNPINIRKKYVYRFLGIIGCVGANCILVSVGCHYLFCGKSDVLGPILSVLSVS